MKSTIDIYIMLHSITRTCSPYQLKAISLSEKSDSTISLGNEEEKKTSWPRWWWIIYRIIRIKEDGDINQGTVLDEI